MNTSELIGRSANSAHDRAGPLGKMFMGEQGRHRADRRADRGEQDDRRETQPLGDRLAERHKHEQRREHGKDEDDIGHGLLTSLGTPGGDRGPYCRGGACALSTADERAAPGRPQEPVGSYAA